MRDLDEISTWERIILTTPLSSDKNLFELSSFQNIAFWWFFDYDLHDFLKKMNIGEEWKNIQVIKKRLSSSFFSYFTNLFRFWFYYGLKLVSIGLLELFRKNNLYDPQNTKKQLVLITGEDIEWRTIYWHSGRTKKQDQFFSSIIHLLNKNGYGVISTYDLRFPFYKSMFILIDKLRHWEILHIPFERYFTFDGYREHRNALTHFKKIWAEIESDPLFHQMTTEHWPECSQEIRSHLQYYFTVVFPHNLLQIRIARQLLIHWNPSIILLEEEYGRFERALIIAARLQGIPTLAIQHGIITPQHKGYIFKKGEISDDLSTYYPYVPLPTKTAVYGKYHKSILTEISYYPKDSVIITGQPRYDRLSRLSEIYSRERFEKRYGIHYTNKIIVWTTQCHGISDAENILNLEAVCSAMQKLPDVTLIVKQHPGEGSYHTRMIHQYLLQHDIDARLVPKTTDTFEYLYISDLVITRHSTTGMEAVALHKPLIVLNLSGEPDKADYVAAGVARGVYKREDLVTVITQLLSDDAELAKNRQKYIQNYLYRIDGNASERVVDAIKQLIDGGPDAK